MRILPFIEFCAIIVGIVAIVAGRFFDLRNGVVLGILLIGSGILLGGLVAILTHRVNFHFFGGVREDYIGAPALIAGAMQILVGSLVIAAGYLIVDGTWHSTLDFILKRPWPVLLAFGLLLVGSGLLLMLTANKRGGIARLVFIAIPKAIAGFVIFLAGLAVVIAGAWEWIDPQSFRTSMTSMMQRLDLNLQLAERWWRSGLRLLR